MATSKSGPTLAALTAQIAALQAQADALRKTEMAEVIAKVKDAIARLLAQEVPAQKVYGT